MRVVVAHGRARERRRFRRVLAEAGHDVAECDCVDDALDAALHGSLTSRWSTRPPATALVEKIKRDPTAFRHGGRCSSNPSEPGVDACRGGAATRRAGHPRRAGARRRARHPRAGGRAHEGPAGGDRRPGQAARGAAVRGPAHRALQPPLHPHAARGHGQRRPPPRPAAHRRGHRHRPLQACQRHASGHAEGDRVLAAVAHAIREHLRAEDQLGRLGGEEFLRSCPRPTPRAANTATEHMRENVAAGQRRHDQHRLGDLGGEEPDDCCAELTMRCTLQRRTGAIASRALLLPCRAADDRDHL